MYYDAHCHLDLLENMMDILKALANENIGMLAVGTTPKAYLKEIQMCAHTKNVHVALGFHPQLIGTGYDDWRLFESLVQQCHYIGEVGLDFSKDYIVTKENQIDIFKKILCSCNQYGDKVVSIHSLKSAATIIEILGNSKQNENNTYILHWFTGSIVQMKKALELGCYFSINPKMLRTKSGINLIQKIPLDRILLETDAPFSVTFKDVKQLDIILKDMIDQISILKGVDISKHLIHNEKVVFRY